MVDCGKGFLSATGPRTSHSESFPRGVTVYLQGAKNVKTSDNQG
jgi:hypothetical protein